MFQLLFSAISCGYQCVLKDTYSINAELCQIVNGTMPLYHYNI